MGGNTELATSLDLKFFKFQFLRNTELFPAGKFKNFVVYGLLE